MIEAKTLEALNTYLFSDKRFSAFTILDGASVPDLPQNLALFNPEHICLYRGELEPDMADVAPYLAFLEPASPFTDWVLKGGWGAHWGIFGTTTADLPTLRKHFRRFLTVYDQSGNSLYFRYYDPRVWVVYLPTCNPEELRTVFGPVLSYVAEDEERQVGIRFSLSRDVLVQDNFQCRYEGG